MIQFGSSSCSPCTGIAIENLNLDGQGQTISGIVNQYSGSLSYVDHVSLYQILGGVLAILLRVLCGEGGREIPT